MSTNPNFIATTAHVPLGRRSAPRARIRANAVVETTTGKTAVILRNLSCTGAMAQGRHLPEVGRDVLLIRDRIEVFATVVWREADRCGLRFYDPLPHETVVAEARKPPEKCIRPYDPWPPAGAEDVQTYEEWQQVQANVEREYEKLRGFS